MTSNSRPPPAQASQKSAAPQMSHRPAAGRCDVAGATTAPMTSLDGLRALLPAAPPIAAEACDITTMTGMVSLLRLSRGRAHESIGRRLAAQGVQSRRRLGG